VIQNSGREVLDSWKQIAKYLHRDVRTCYRWSKELRLPVYRIDDKSSRSKVFAYKDEIDKWLNEKARIKVLNKNGHKAKKILVYGGPLLLAALSIVAIAKLPLLSPSSKPVAVAVFPLKNLNPSGNDDYLSAELAKAIAENLPVPNKLRVIEANNTRLNSAELTDMEKLGNELDADYLLRGDFQKGNLSVQVSAELISLKSRAIVWNSQFSEPIERAIAVPPRICEAVLKALKISRGAIVRNDMSSRDSQALDSYLKGDFILDRLNAANDDPWGFYHQGQYYAGRFTPEANEFAISLFLKAIAIDPNFAQAYIGLAGCYANFVNFNWRFDAVWLDKADELLEKAQRLIPDLPEYFYTLIEVRLLKQSFDPQERTSSVGGLVEEGIKKYQNHSRLNSIVGYYYYKKYGEEGDERDFKKAMEFKERSFWLSPFDIGNIVYANLLMLNREFERAFDVCRVLERVDITSMAKFLTGEILYYQGDLDGSLSLFEKIADASFEYKISALYYMAMIWARKGDQVNARNVLAEIERASPPRFNYFEKDLRLASAWAGLGEKDLARKALLNFLSGPSYRRDPYIYRKYLDLDDNFFELRKEDGFKKLLDQKEEANGKKQGDSGHA
jgi:TolB-like protein